MLETAGKQTTAVEPFLSRILLGEFVPFPISSISKLLSITEVSSFSREHYRLQSRL